MRKLMWFTIGFGGACAVGAYWLCEYLLFFCVAAAVLSGAAFLLRDDWKWLRPACAVFLGMAMGFGWFLGFDSIRLEPARHQDGQTISVIAEVSDYSYSTDYGCAVKGNYQLDGQEYAVLLYLDEDKALSPGDQVSGLFRLRYTNASEDVTYHRGNGVFLLAYQEDAVQIAEADAVPLKLLPAVMRQWIIDRINEVFPADTAFFARALLLGDRTDVDYETNTAFKISGISHIIAVSGLHISILFSVVMLLAGRRRVLSAMVGIPVLVLFAAVAGFTPSITRACLMQILMLLSLLFDREYDPPTSLSFAALVMLVCNPMVITSASFQLSVGCMAGIFLFSNPIRTWILNFKCWSRWDGKSLGGRLRNWFAAGVSVTISAMFFTTPLVACYFGAVSLIGVVTNLLTLWAVSVVFYGIMTVCLLSLFWMKAAAAAAWAISWLIRYILAVAKTLSAFPLAAVYTKSVYIVFWLVFAYMLGLVFLLLKRKKPYVLICCGVLGLVVALLLSWTEPLLDENRMMVLDVGQGQCILLQSEGRTYMVDCGGDSDSEAADMAAETLLSMGIYRLDGLILTHYDRDHAGGVGYLLSRIPADAVFLPASEDDGALDGILPYCEDTVRFVDDDLELAWGNSKMIVYGPLLSKSDNESGLSVLFDGGKCDILITGDMSTMGEMLLVKQKQLSEVTAIVAGHHGSKSSTGELLLQATKPEYAFISVGEDNYYGHPSDAVLQRLQAVGCAVYRTDLHGTIIFRR